MSEKAKKKNTEVIETLVRLLEHDAPERRAAAAIVLGELGVDDASAVDALRKAIKRTDDVELRLRAAEAIGAIGPKTIVKDLRPLMKDPSSEVMSMAKHVLATSEAITTDEIASMLRSKDDRQRVGAIAVLGARGGPRERTALLEQLVGASNRIGDAVVDALRPMLLGLDEEEGRMSVEDIRKLATPENLEDAGFADRVVTLLAFVEGNDSALALLEMAGLTPHPEVKARAIESLRTVLSGRRPEQRVFRFLLEQLEGEDVDPRIVAAAVDTLTVFDVPIALEPRVRALIDAEAANVRRWALKALGGLDTAPAAKALAKMVQEGDATDRTVALDAALATHNGRAALAKALIAMTDVEKARAVAAGLRGFAAELAPSTLHTLEQAVVDAEPEIAQVIIDLLKQCGRSVKEAQGGLLDKAMRLKAKGQWAEAAELFRRICSSKDADPEARYQLGVCELKMSKHKITRGSSKDPCVDTFDALTRSHKFPVVDRLSAESILEPEELYFLGFSLAEGKGGGQDLGGDILTVLAESAKDAKLAQMAKNKLQRMGWLE